jgi:hypothetical protein
LGLFGWLGVGWLVGWLVGFLVPEGITWAVSTTESMLGPYVDVVGEVGGTVPPGAEGVANVAVNSSHSFSAWKLRNGSWARDASRVLFLLFLLFLLVFCSLFPPVSPPHRSVSFPVRRFNTDPPWFVQARYIDSRHLSMKQAGTGAPPLLLGRH